MWLTLLLVLPLAAYLLVLALLWLNQTRLLFPAGQVAAAGPLPPGAAPLELVTPSGERLRGVHLSATGPAREHLMILAFGGNAWNAQETAVLLHDIFPEADVVAFHYRGYAPSEGEPGAAALQRDALLVHDFARDRLRPVRTIVIGFSIGSGVAAALAAQRPVDGLILVTPFDSLGRVAGGHYPWLPIRRLLRHRMEPAADLRSASLPVALIAGGRDTLIPPARTEALRRAIPDLAFDFDIADAGHNDIYRHPRFRPAMREAMARLVAR
ncbi:MAG: alpha/beta hydrolase [Allosphingosinicella sp.]